MCELSKVDPNFEYDAPNYVDFNLLKQGVDDGEADLWFGECLSLRELIIYPVMLFCRKSCRYSGQGERLRR